MMDDADYARLRFLDKEDDDELRSFIVDAAVILAVRTGRSPEVVLRTAAQGYDRTFESDDEWRAGAVRHIEEAWDREPQDAED